MSKAIAILLEVILMSLSSLSAPAPSETILIEDVRLTAYCSCEKCCGKTDGITATGVKATAGKTIAVDPKAIPYGTKVEIYGKTYVAEDCGGAIKGNKRIDIYCDSHRTALEFGVQYADVKVEI